MIAGYWQVVALALKHGIADFVGPFHRWKASP